MMLDQANENQESNKPVDESAESKAVAQVEDAIAKESEEGTEVEVVDYSKYSLDELADALEKLVKNEPVQSIKKNVDDIKSVFNANFAKLLAEKKAAFLAEGGNSIDFQFSLPAKTKYNSLLADYKQKRDKYYGELEKQLNQNLNTRLLVIDSLKELIESADPKTMYKDFQELKKRWNSIGPVPRNKYNDTWRNFHHHVERFYDLLHLSNDYRDLDFKHNLEEKIKLVEQAEALAAQEDVMAAFKELQELHRKWKEDYGPVAREHREEIWGRFSAATKKIHENRDAYFSGLKSRYEENIEKKRAVIEKIKAFDFNSYKNHSDWQKGIKDFEALREEYFAVGKVPKAKSNEIWGEFKEATRPFNHAKNKFYKDVKKEQQDNLNKKLKLVEVAQSLSDSDDFDSSTETMKRIQAEWKRIGHVPRKFSDSIWRDFKTACNHYFDRLHKAQDQRDTKGNEAYEAKKVILDQARTMSEEGTEASVEQIMELANNWKDVGPVPGNKRHIEGKFDKALEKVFAKLGVPKDEAAMFRFKTLVDALMEEGNTRKLESEMNFVRKKIDECVKEATQLENNLSFISNAGEDNPLVQNVKKSIAEFEQEMDIWNMKYNYLKSLDF
ncbi:DUF349 domain-containing protein [Flavobacteriaceae bacterium]|nr:DUF349 domain-containing protein [Flavobacteriaceae bacterium]